MREIRDRYSNTSRNNDDDDDDDVNKAQAWDDETIEYLKTRGDSKPPEISLTMSINENWKS